MQNSGTRRSLCRLRLRLFHVMLDVFRPGPEFLGARGGARIRALLYKH
jgi:hypothetical protein